jgi:hypothetical protein
MLGALHSRGVPDNDEDNVGALAEAGWSEKEVMVVLDDKAQSMVEKYTACAQRQRSPPV